MSEFRWEDAKGLIRSVACRSKKFVGRGYSKWIDVEGMNE